MNHSETRQDRPITTLVPTSSKKNHVRTSNSTTIKTDNKNTLHYISKKCHNCLLPSLGSSGVIYTPNHCLARAKASLILVSMICHNIHHRTLLSATINFVKQKENQVHMDQWTSNLAKKKDKIIIATCESQTRSGHRAPSCRFQVVSVQIWCQTKFLQKHLFT